MNLRKPKSVLITCMLTTLLFAAALFYVENTNALYGKEKHSIGLFLITYLNTELKIDHEINYKMSKSLLGARRINYFQLNQHIRGEIDEVFTNDKYVDCLVGKNFQTQCTVHNGSNHTAFTRKKKGIVKIHKADEISYKFNNDGTFAGKYTRMGKFFDWSYSGTYDSDGISSLDVSIPIGLDFIVTRQSGE